MDLCPCFLLVSCELSHIKTASPRESRLSKMKEQKRGGNDTIYRSIELAGAHEAELTLYYMTLYVCPSFIRSKCFILRDSVVWATVKERLQKQLYY